MRDVGGGGGAVRGEPWDAIAAAGGACFEGRKVLWVRQVGRL